MSGILVVKKFGGTSVANPEKIRLVAESLLNEVKGGKRIVVVVSAQAGFTDGVLSAVNKVIPDKSNLNEELDVVLAAGEQMSCGMLALILKSMGVTAKSFLGWQLPIMTCSTFGKAKIEEINVSPLVDFFNSGGNVAVIAGFQGVNLNFRITTLGRGGSDTSAVAIAASLGVGVCEIYSDVKGVFTADPNVIKSARKKNVLTFEEMLEMAFLGSKIMHVRAVEVAMLNNIALRILSTFEPDEGTLVVSNSEYENMNQNIVQISRKLVSGVAHTKNEAGISLSGNQLSVIDVFRVISEKNINVDMIAQTVSEISGTMSLTFTVSLLEADSAIKILSENQKLIGYSALAAHKDVAKVSIVGVAMLSNSGIAYKALKALSDSGVLVRAITTSEIKISVLVSGDECDTAIEALHSTFELDKD